MFMYNNCGNDVNLYVTRNTFGTTGIADNAHKEVRNTIKYVSIKVFIY